MPNITFGEIMRGYLNGNIKRIDINAEVPIIFDDVMVDNIYAYYHVLCFKNKEGKIFQMKDLEVAFISIINDGFGIELCFPNETKEPISESIDEPMHVSDIKESAKPEPYSSKNSHQRPRWTESEIAIIRDSSKTSEEVAAVLGRTVKSVQTYRSRFKIKGPISKCSFNDDEVSAMSDPSISAKEISEAFGRPLNSIYRWRSNNGIKPIRAKKSK